MNFSNKFELAEHVMPPHRKAGNRYAKLQTASNYRIMRRLVFISCLLVLTSPLVYGQGEKTLLLQKCSKRWEYRNLDQPFKGTIIYFEQPVVMCGTFSTASVALIKDDKGEVVRVLTLCNSKKNFNATPAFKHGEKVFATPSDKPGFRIDLMPIDSASCQIQSAYFALLKTVEQP